MTIARKDGGRPTPGIVIVFAAGAPVLRTMTVGSAPIELGRESVPSGTPTDKAMSRRHARISHVDDAWQVTDLDSHNGSAIDGELLNGTRTGAMSVLRLAQTVCLLEGDARPYVGELATKPIVMGPRLHAIWNLLRQLSDQPTLHIHGESGTGKELAARAFHDLGAKREGPFVAVNCAAIPQTLAEAMLFGARKGAFSGADRDTEGLFAAADHGTLFLDEIGELDLVLQAKLLRVLETREVLAVGATKPRAIDIRICSASHRKLKDLVAQGSFREDLYFRIGRPEIVLPPLRERREEIPAYVCRAVHEAAPDLAVDASLVEACLLRTWPGNIRELLVEIRHATQLARTEASPSVAANHLAATAGTATAPAAPAGAAPVAAATRERTGEAPLPPRDQILDLLRRSGGRVATAARTLGIPRIRLRRWLEREKVDPTTLVDPDDSIG